MDETLTRDPSAWQALFDEVSQGRRGQPVTIEILDQDFGDQTEAERMPFDSVGYDARSEVIIIALGGRSSRWPVTLRHMIHKPVQVDLLEQPHAAMVVRVVDRDGGQTLLRFRPENA